MSRFPPWFFRSMDPGEVHVDPVHDEFFKMQDLADALVREAVQNSLDARRRRAGVRVRFRFGAGGDALSPEGAEQYFLGLRQHLDAAKILSILPGESEPVPYLLVEDFGTRGLTGDPAIDPELESDESTRNDFFYFWRNVGRSSKSDVDRGRWGLGKAVFPVASRIRTIFGLTRRADDGRSLLLGQSVLKEHIIDGTRFDPYGFFARFEKRNGMPLPVEDPILLERFADDFRLFRTEPGLSIVIPYFRADELSVEKLVAASIRQYFYPIVRGDLVIEVSDATRSESISGRTIDDVARRYALGEAVERLAALTRWSLTEAEEKRVEITIAQGERAPKWSEEAIAAEELGALRDRFDRGEPLGFRVALPVKRKRSRPAASFFDVILQKDDALRRADVHFIRGGITISDVRSTAGSDKPLRALVVIDDDALSTFLGDSENPAHSDWSERADKLRLLYDQHAYTLRFVKNSAAFLGALMTRPPEGRMRDFLTDIFSIESAGETESMATGPKHPGTHDDGSGDQHEGERRAQRVAITAVKGGFTVAGTGDEAVLARPFSIEMAYRARSGNPFRRHSRFDFDATTGEVRIEAEGARYTRSAANVVRFVPASARFHLTMKGFDPRRDLVVRVAEDESDAAEAELH